MSDQTEKFEGWGIVEMLGHRQLAGKIGQQVIAGCAFLRVDVPETQHTKQVPGYGGTVIETKPGYTKHIGTGSIYCITPTDEDTSRRAAAVLERFNDPLPVSLPKLLPAGAVAVDVVDADVELDELRGSGLDDDEDLH